MGAVASGWSLLRRRRNHEEDDFFTSSSCSCWAGGRRRSEAECEEVLLRLDAASSLWSRCMLNGDDG